MSTYDSLNSPLSASEETPEEDKSIALEQDELLKNETTFLVTTTTDGTAKRVPALVVVVLTSPPDLLRQDRNLVPNETHLDKLHTHLPLKREGQKFLLEKFLAVGEKLFSIILWRFLLAAFPRNLRNRPEMYAGRSSMG